MNFKVIFLFFGVKTSNPITNLIQPNDFAGPNYP